MPPREIKPRVGMGLASLLVITLTGCGTIHQQRLGVGEVPTLIGPPVRDNRTPMDVALACIGQTIGSRTRPLVIAVGDVRDYTGKYSVNEGNAITQGGALMVSSALGKLGRGVALAERFDPTIAERELGYANHRQLGDGQVHDVTGASGVSKVPWLPYYGGSIAASDFYIVGGITELNYDVRSGGLDASATQIGPKARTYTQSVAIDLQIVDTKSLLVVRTVSLTKQFTGYEVGFNLFRFFGSELFDINIGAKGQEPVQLGVRTALEEAVARLVGAVARIDPAPCLARSGWSAGSSGTRTDYQTATTAAFRSGSVSGVPATNTVAKSGAGSAAVILLRFDYGSASLSSSVAFLDHVIGDMAAGSVEILIVAPDTEAPDPAKRDSLIDLRVAALVAALAARGIQASAIEPIWRPSASDTVIRRADAGLQSLARLRVRSAR